MTDEKLGMIEEGESAIDGLEETIIMIEEGGRYY
jgi:hypothetical protein